MKRHTIAVFGASSTVPGSQRWLDAERLGNALASRGYRVATGGYGGTMEATSCGAAAAGGRVIGVTAPHLFPQRTGANGFVDDERPAATLCGRIGELLAVSSAVVALPGSLGTFTELMVAWNEIFIERLSDRSGIPVVAVGPKWAELLPSIGRALETDHSLVQLAPTVDDAVALIDGAVG